MARDEAPSPRNFKMGMGVSWHPNRVQVYEPQSAVILSILPLLKSFFDELIDRLPPARDNSIDS
jgi:hypothetical protein